MSLINPQRPRVYYRNRGYGALGVIGLSWAILWRTLMIIGLVAAMAIGLMVGLGIIGIFDVPRIIENLWTGSSGTGSGKI